MTASQSYKLAEVAAALASTFLQFDGEPPSYPHEESPDEVAKGFLHKSG
ncbi:MAG TPA: hypothetical protein VN541_23645 [Tepidisphaeraceae bacterium]|nr:hypothetical protein [Tepidisphaeraceae bacterium]